jgi:aryl-alcohol dehydrogenase-like predicted oxidoreductase
MQTRRLGKTDLELSVIGMGGVVVMQEQQAEADRMVAEAVDAGITYFDVAPQYMDAQQRMGPALQPYREGVTLACKTLERTAKGVRRELDDSLKKLRTDRFDLYQMHSITTVDEAKRVLGPGGAMEAFAEAKRAGKVRYIGFSAHGQEAALHLVGSGLFDSVLFPLNVVMFERGEFGPGLLDAANERGMGVLALKAIARTRVPGGVEKPYDKCWYMPEDRAEVAHLMLRYTLNLAGVTAALPPGDPGLYRMAVGFAGELGPLSDEELAALKGAVAGVEPLFPLPNA